MKTLVLGFLISWIGLPAKAQENVQVDPNRPEVFTLVPDMPRFLDPECEAIESKQERNQCAQRALLNYLKTNYRYPKGTGDICVEGIIVIKFIVDSVGKVVEPFMQRSLHPLFDQTALDLVHNFPDFEPGKVRRRPVPVRLNIPIRLRLLD
ncbi:MAG: energy transducer TonB [Bacteroidota bacterium]